MDMAVELRKALPVHHTGTSNVAWDGPGAKTNLRVGETEDYYKSAFAWQDPEGDPKTKAAYKFINHEVDANGTIGAANITACRAGIAVLNGGRGGTTIPDADRQGVYNHLAAHLKDADLEPPELKSFADEKTEYRTFGFEVRKGEEIGNHLAGHAAVFDTLADIGGWFREKIARGAFDKTLADKADVKALFNHNPSAVLGRTTSGTLKLSTDDRGLVVDIDVAPTTVGNDLLISVKRGDVDQMSFAFDALQEEWDERDPQNPIRTLKEVKLHDVSPVTYPAYPTTDVSARSAESVLTEHRKATPTQEANEPRQEPHSEPIAPVTPDYATANESRRKRLALLELES
jgi:HK97 family phage prohead protease